MQARDSILTNSRTDIYLDLIAVLEDIAQNIEIRDDFSIHHPDYQPLEIPTEAVARFQQMPESIKQKFLNSQLCGFLYGIYYNGSMRSQFAIEAIENTPPPNLENKLLMGMDMAFFQRLHDANCGDGYFSEGWLILKSGNNPNDHLIVKNGGLKLCIQREQHLKAADQQAKVGDLVAIKLPKNRLQNEFYVAIGNLGFSSSSPADVLVRIYFNLTPEGSVAVMASLTAQLNHAGILFSFKVLYNPKRYHRFDAGVLYFDKTDYQTVSLILTAIHSEHRAHFGLEIPLFTKQLATGISLAEEPDKKFAQSESFGMNRCQIVTDGLLKAFYSGQDSSVERMSTILSQFSTVGIDLRHPYLNHDSENIYHSFGVIS
jgi:HopA1 effector protein family